MFSQRYVYCGKVIDVEEEAYSVWISILKRKGLPLDTPYEYVPILEKAYDESYCDMLCVTVRKKKENPEAAKSWPVIYTCESAPAPAPGVKESSSDYPTVYFAFDERKYGKRVTRNVNAILHGHEECQDP